MLFSYWVSRYGGRGPCKAPVKLCGLPDIVPVELLGTTWEQHTVSVCGVVRVASIVLLFTADTFRHYRGTTTAVCVDCACIKTLAR